MIQHVKKYLRRSALLAFSRMFYIVVVLFIQFYFSRHLPKNVFGNYQQYFIQVGFCGAMLIGALTYPIGLMTPRNVIVNLLALLKKAKWVFIAAGAVVLGTLYFATAIEVFPILLLLILCTAVYTIQEAILINWGKDQKVLVINLVYTSLFLLVHLWLMPSAGNIQPLLQGWLILAALKAGIGSYFIVTDAHFRKTGVEKKTTVIYKQWLWLWANEAVENVNTYLDKLLLIFLISQELYAVYMMGAYELPFFSIIVAVIGFQFNIQHSDEATIAETLSIFKTGALFIASFIFPVFCLLYMQAGNIFHAFLGVKYDQSVPLFKLTLLAVPLRITYYCSIIQVMHKNKYILWGSILCIVVYVLLIPVLYHYFQLQGLIVASVLSTYIQIVYYLWISARLIDVPFLSIFPFGHLLAMLGLNFLCFRLVGSLFAPENAVLSLVLAMIPFLLMLSLNYFGIYKNYVKKNLIA